MSYCCLSVLCPSQLPTPSPMAYEPLNNCTNRTPRSSSRRARTQLRANPALIALASSAPYMLERVGRLFIESGDLGGRQLHLGGQLVTGNAAGKFRIAGMCCQVTVVEQLQKISRRAVRPVRSPRRAASRFGIGLLGIEGRALKDRRQETPSSNDWAADLRHAARIGNRHEGRQVAALRAQRISHPDSRCSGNRRA